MDDRFELFDQVEARFPKILAAGVLALVLFLIGLDMLGQVSWRWLGFEIGLFDSPASKGPAVDGCTEMPDGLVVCEQPPAGGQGGRP